MIPIFSSNYSIGKSILTLNDPEDEIKDNSPVSIFSILKKYSINDLFLVDNSFSGFIEAYTQSEKNKINLKFGIKLVVCSDANEKTEESIKTESKIIIFLKNSAAYKDAIKIYSKAATEYKYYYPRISWTQLGKMWTDNLLLCLPFYGNFLHKNLLKNYTCLPIFCVKPLFFIESHKIPFDSVLKNVINNYCKHNNYQTLNTHQIYYYKNSDALHYQIYKIALNRHENSSSSINKPNLDHFSSDCFSWEEFLKIKDLKYD